MSINWLIVLQVNLSFVIRKNKQITFGENKFQHGFFLNDA